MADAARIIALDVRVHSLGVMEQPLDRGIGFRLRERAREAVARRFEGTARQVGMPGALESPRHRAVHLLEQRIQREAEDRFHFFRPLDHEPHRPVVAQICDQQPELVGGPLREGFQLAHALVEPIVHGAEHLLELVEQGLRLLPGIGLERAHARAVDLALVEVLAQLHRLVEQRAHGEIEQRLAMRGAANDAAGPAEQRVGPLLEPEQHAALVVADQRGELREAQPVRAMAPREPPDEPVDFDEIAQDLEDPRGAPHGSNYMGMARGTRESRPGRVNAPAAADRAKIPFTRGPDELRSSARAWRSTSSTSGQARRRWRRRFT